MHYHVMAKRKSCLATFHKALGQEHTQRNKGTKLVECTDAGHEAGMQRVLAYRIPHYPSPNAQRNLLDYAVELARQQTRTHTSHE